MEVLRQAMRRAGLQALAAQLPTRQVLSDDDFLAAQKQFWVVQRLLTLRPPPAAAFRHIAAPLRRVSTVIALVDRLLRERDEESN